MPLAADVETFPRLARHFEIVGDDVERRGRIVGAGDGATRHLLIERRVFGQGEEVVGDSSAGADGTTGPEVVARLCVIVLKEIAIGERCDASTPVERPARPGPKSHVQETLCARYLVPHAADRGDDVIDADAEGGLEVDEVEVFRTAADVEPVGREELHR